MGGIALSFLVIYGLERDTWWALIPGGVMLTMALVTSLDEFAPNIETGGVFFLGLGATFGALALTNTKLGQLRWAWIPAVVLVIIGVFMLATTVNLFAFITPAALVLVGAYLIWRTIATRNNGGMD